MPVEQQIFSASHLSPSPVVKEEKKIWVAFDQSVTYRELLPGVKVRCMERPLNETFAEYLYSLIIARDLSGLRKIAAGSTVIFKNLPVQSEVPSEDGSTEEFRRDILLSKVRSEQEVGLLKLAQNPDIGCTMTSSMPAQGGMWGWFGMGEIGRASVFPDRQMILRKGRSAFVSKLSEVMIIKYGLDMPESERSEPEHVFFVEDDLNIARLISRFLQVPVLVPIDKEQEANYPILPIPKVLKNSYEELYIGAGLFDLSRSLYEYLEGEIPKERFDAYRFQVNNAVELLRGLRLEDFQSIPSSSRAY